MRYLFFLIALFFAANANAQTETTPQLDIKNAFFAPKFYIDGERANRWDFRYQIREDEQALRRFKKGANLRGLGYGAGALGATMLIFEYDRRKDDGTYGRNSDNIANMVLYTSWACIVGGAGMYYRGHLWQKRAVEVYNGEEEQSSLRLGPTRDGMGLTLTF